jgi:tetratricopeptide (TPR) repeat protein
VDISKVSRALEAVRLALNKRRTGLRGLVALDQQIGLAESSELREVLVKLRDQLFAAIRNESLERLKKRFASDPPIASAEWLHLYSAALHLRRIDFCRKLADASFDLGPGLPAIADFAHWTAAMADDRWIEAEPVFRLLFEKNDLDSDQRVTFGLTLARIALYQRADPKAASELLSQIEKLAPDSAAAFSLRGELRLDEGNLEDARAEFEQAIRRDPRSDASYLIGDTFERQKDFEQAEARFREATIQLADDTAPYIRLFSLLGRHDCLAEQEAVVLDLVERAAAADPVYAHSVYSQLGDVYERNGEYEKAYTWYSEAEKSDPNDPGPHVAKAYASLSQSRFDDAKVALHRAIELAPEAFDGHWGLASLYESDERFDDALKAYEDCLRLRPTWASQIAVRMAASERGAGQFEMARERLLTAFRVEPDNDSSRRGARDTSPRTGIFSGISASGWGIINRQSMRIAVR